MRGEKRCRGDGDDDEEEEEAGQRGWGASGQGEGEHQRRSSKAAKREQKAIKQPAIRRAEATV